MRRNNNKVDPPIDSSVGSRMMCSSQYSSQAEKSRISQLLLLPEFSRLLYS